MGPPDAGLVLLADETPQKNEYFWPTEVEITRIDENGVEVHDSVMQIPQPQVSGVIIKGNVNLDNVIDNSDLVKLENYIQGNGELSLGESLNADMNSDGVVDATDLELLKVSIN